MPEADLVGEVLDGRYRVIEEIGHGAMGIVYRGERIKLGRAVAIKVLHDSLPHELAGRKRFELEARAMAQLEHPHCVAVLDVGLHEGRPYVVMDFVSGTDLRTLIGTGRVEAARAVAMVKQVLSGLAHAHELGIVHRDIKPANLMVGHKTGIGDQVKILDFGLARSLDPDAKRLTGGMVLGTPSYMAPEQCRGGTIDGRTDLYAVGILLFELLTGRKPFESPADDPVEVVGMHLHRVPPLLRDIVPDVEWGALEGVVARALAKKPEDRYPTAAELAAALGAAVERNEETVPFEPVMLDDLAAYAAASTAAAEAAAASVPAPDANDVSMSTTLPRTVTPLPSVMVEAGLRADATPLPVRPSPQPGKRPTPQPTTPLPPPHAAAAAPASEPPAPPVPVTVSLPPPRSADPRLATEPVHVQQRRLHIAAGVVGGVLILAVILRACTGSGTSTPPAPGALADAGPPVSHPMVSAIPPDAAVAVVPSPAPPVDAGAGASGTIDPEDPAGAALIHAAERVSAHDVDGALEVLADAHRKFVANPDIPYMAGRLQIAKGQYTQGLASLRTAIHLFGGYADDPELAKIVVEAFMSTPSRHADLARFIHDDLGHAAIPQLTASRDHAATPALRARAAAELKRLH